MSYKLIPRILLSIILWLGFILLVQTPLIIIGWVIIPPMAYFRYYKIRKSLYYDRLITVFKSEWVNLIWGNEEDSINAGRQYKACKTEWGQIIYWSANRNPVNNLRFAPIVSCKLQPPKIRFVGSFVNLVAAGPFLVGPEYEAWKTEVLKYDRKTPQWFFAWQGLYSNFYCNFMFRGQLRRFWIGWKVVPRDIIAIPEYKKFGASCALQFRTVK